MGKRKQTIFKKRWFDITTSERWDLTVSIMHFSSLFNNREHPILPSIFWGIHREESEVGYLRSTSGQRTSGVLHCGKMTEEVALVSMFIENRFGEYLQMYIRHKISTYF